ncbi:hypothetical protein ACFYYB_17765 [Streptomyces sp. NPDC002886]|uniref:hypothetical protein n=1 Tax=Streptomyces sp. NPDC002886 TaxID=3364667 RepID=UPI00368952C0
MSRTKWAAVMTAVIALGAAGCGSGTGAGSSPVSPRPEGTGLLTREVVRADLDTSAAAAGAPANDPEWLSRSEESSAWRCAVVFKGYGTEAEPVDVARFKATVRELDRRDWEDAGESEERKDEDEVYVSRVLLDQRGWRIVAEYWGKPAGGIISLVAFDNACEEKRRGGEEGAAG